MNQIYKFNLNQILRLLKVFFGSLIALSAFGHSGVFAQTQFSELTKLSYALGNSSDNFSNSMAIDGNTIIVGAKGYDFMPSSNSNNGAAFIYVRQPNGAWTLQQSLFPGVTSTNFNFGNCVGISGDTAIVGSPGEEAAYIYVRSGTTWTQFQRITIGSQGGFGQQCGISGNSVIISARNEPSGVPNSAGAVYIFALNGATWTQQARLTAITGTLGATIGDAVTIEGDTVVLGVQSDESFRGSAQIFVRNGTTWTAQQRILASDGFSGDLFGTSAAINGNTLVVGASKVTNPNALNEGAAYVFTRNGGVWTEQQKLISGDARPQASFGTSVAVEGDTAVVGAINNNSITGGGRGYVYQRSGTIWTRTQRLLSADDHRDTFGFTADISGSNVVIGALADKLGLNGEQGSAYIFTANPTNCTYSLSPTRSSLFPSGGGTGSFNVTTQAGCVWQATVQDRVTWTTTSSAGMGSGTINFSVAGNSGKPRRAEISINGQQVYYVNQSAGSAAQQGDFDQIFFNTGFTTNKVFETNVATKVKVQPDGKTVVVGNSFGTSGDAAIVLRYNTDGTLDTTFDGDGIVTTVIENTGSSFADVVIQPDGKIVAAGSAIPLNADQYFAVVRYNANGSLDTTFGTGGIVRTDFDSTSEGASAIALTSDGKIVVAGTTFNNSFAVARYNANGSLDTTFDGDGKATVSGIAVGTPSDMALQSDGKIVGLVEGNGATFLRLNANGSLDTTFDGDGKVEMSNSIFRLGITVAVQPDGKILGAGTYSNSGAGTSPIAVARLNLNGSLDTTFAGDGVANDPIFSAIPRDIALQTNGKIVVAGTQIGGGIFGNDVLVLRFNPNGTPDTTFGGDGRVQSNEDLTFQDADDLGNGVALAPDGKIAVAGNYRFRVGQQDVMVLRFLGEGIGGIRSPFDFDGDGKTDLSIFRPSGGEWWYQKSSGGNAALIFGTATDKLVPADYTGDGKTDVAFWRPSNGQWFILRSEDLSFFAFPFGTSGDVPVPADYDGDGKADAAVFRESSQTWFIQKSSGGTDIIGFGAVGDKPVVADYDGDGKADIAIYRPNGANGGEWWIRRSSNASVFALQFGTSTDKPVQGDFTGDGKADVAFWRPSNGNWFILRSEDFSFFAFPFGANGDVPVPGDYDGDGKFDAGVFRPSNQTWFIQRSSAGTLIQQFGVAGDLPLPSAFIP